MSSDDTSSLHVERTSLAWERTILLLVVASLGGARLLLPVIGVGAWAVAVVGVAGAGALFAFSRRRSRSPRDSAAGWLVAGTAMLTLVVAVAGACLVVSFSI